jgi:ActR/RegA family two-component response regulator
MAKTHVVILEDDSTLGSALKTAFERAGADVFLTPSVQDAQADLEKNKAVALFVDCLLPSGSGVDFVESIRKKFPPSDLNIVMMSGIFTDPAVIKEINRSTKAISFLKKPFELQEALSLVKIEKIEEPTEELTPRKQLYLLFNKPKVSIREKRKAIEALDEIHGFDLPYLYSLLVETSASGHLNIIGSKGEVLGISISSGKIVSVDLADAETQIGNLLIEGGYIKPDDLQEALAQRSAKKIGERLITSNLLSPHAFNIAMANQMSIRLSRTIVDLPVKVNFVASEVDLTYPHVDSQALSQFLHDWIASKIDLEWLKAHYTQWFDYSLGKSANFTTDNPILKSPLMNHLPGFVDFITSGESLTKLLDQKKYPEEPAYKALHLLLTKGVIIFTEKVALSHTPDERIKHLKKLQEQFVGCTKLEAWEIMVGLSGGTESNPNVVLSEFKKLIGSDPVGGPPELQKIFSELNRLADETFTFATGGEKEKAKAELEKKEVENKQKVQGLFEEAKALLQKAQYAQAMGVIAKLKVMDHNLEKIKVLSIWCKLGQLETQAVKEKAIADIEMEIVQIPPEEKFEAAYQFVMGLYHKVKNEHEAAKKFFEKAYHLDSTFLAARREIALLVQKNQGKGKETGKDLSSLVKGFFKFK